MKEEQTWQQCAVQFVHVLLLQNLTIFMQTYRKFAIRNECTHFAEKVNEPRMLWRLRRRFAVEKEEKLQRIDINIEQWSDNENKITRKEKSFNLIRKHCLNYHNVHNNLSIGRTVCWQTNNVHGKCFMVLRTCSCLFSI